MNLSNIKALILDMDGVLWRDNTPIGDLPAIFARIRERGLKVALATNNATRTINEHLAKLVWLRLNLGTMADHLFCLPRRQMFWQNNSQAVEQYSSSARTASSARWKNAVSNPSSTRMIGQRPSLSSAALTAA